jgi:hypothetical protein
MAVGLSKLAPAKPTNRTLSFTKHTNINEFFLNSVIDRTPVWLNAETGLMAGYPLEDGDVLETASCSPWVDEKNQFQVVGRWSSRTKEGPMSMSKDFGIARYSFPGGQVLDHISTDTIPVGAPCWYPGTRARVLFSGGDGVLYHYAFEPEPWEKTETSEAGRDPKPRPLAWRCSKPGNDDVFFGDLSWPEDPRMGGCLVASLREQSSGPAGNRSYSRTSLWWLKLNFAGTEIVDLGRLLVSDDSRGAGLDFDHRTPVVGSLADGRLVLSYLRQSAGQSGWEVRIVPIEFDSKLHVPQAREADGVRLAWKCQPAQPTFSPDGQFLNVIAGPEARESRVVRVPLKGVLASSR